MNNNNGWIEEDDEDEVEAEEEDEEEMEDEEDEEMEVEDNDDENDAEIIHPYEEIDPLNRPPPSPETAEQEFRVKSSSSKRLERNDMRMDSFDDDLTERDLRAENEMLRIRLRVAEEKAKLRNQLPLKRRYRETPYDPSTNTTSHPRRVDPYVMVRDNAVRADAVSDRGGESVDTTDVVKDSREEKDDEGDAADAKDSQPLESRGSPLRDRIEAAIRAERERAREEATRAGGPAGGPAATPVARECAVGLCRWFKKIESTFGISECAERRKVKFATATLHGRALTWLEDELRHLKLRDMNIAAYTERFNELAQLCPDAVPNEKKKVKLYIKGLPEIIKGETNSSRPARLNDVVCMSHTLIEQKIQANNERIAEGNKRR
ncbi:putative reverse transcriptase domain-containing protein [Tanacetum coccineum]